MNLDELLKDKKVVAVTCNQWGDTGKGKFVDLIAEKANTIIRGTGGDNAGHTICWRDTYGEQELVTHILPSGILYDSSGKTNIIGSGTVLYPKTLILELRALVAKGLTFNNLLVALNAKLILPQHILLDRLRESQAGIGKIGTTGKGIGPAYVDHYSRNGLVVNDLLNKDIFVKKLRKNISDKLQIFNTTDWEVMKNILDSPHLENGAYYLGHGRINEEAIVEMYMDYGEQIKDLIYDTDSFTRNNLGGGLILLEGAQGALLSIDHGTYPFVTASDCTVAGLAQGAGLSPAAVDLSLGIVKMPYMTRVGRGPFPTELGGGDSDRWCNSSEANRLEEEKLFPEASINDDYELFQGVAVRRAGNEYGATTGRPRRTGWLDLPLLRHALKFSGPNTILTKLDVLNDCDLIKICTAYEYRGPDYYYGKQLLTAGTVINNAILSDEVLANCIPIYQEFPGWKKSLENIEKVYDLPAELDNIIDFVMKNSGMRPRIISVGPRRDQTIFC